MLNHVEIEGGDVRILTPQAQLALSNLVKRSPTYSKGAGIYRGVLDVIKATVDSAHVPEVIAANVAPGQTNAAAIAAVDAAALAAGSTPEDLALAKALAAVCMKLKGLPGIAVESEGSEKVKRFFSATVNWDELALDVLNTLYETPAIVGAAFGTVTRKLYDCQGQGRVFDSLDELRFAVRGPIRLGWRGW